jgi:hypothetical protein
MACCLAWGAGLGWTGRARRLRPASLGSAHQHLEQLRRFPLKRPHDGNELDDINAPLAALVFRDERLWPLEPAGNLLLGEPGGPACTDQEFP